MPGIVEKAGRVAVLARPLGIALQYDGLHVVVEHAPGNAAQGRKRALVAVDQRFHLHVGDEFDVARPAVAERGAEGVERIVPLAEFHPIDLHLFARCGLEAYHRVFSPHRAQAAQKGSQLADSASISVKDYGWSRNI